VSIVRPVLFSDHGSLTLVESGNIRVTRRATSHRGGLNECGQR
jgi:hypothetical protein